MTNEHNVRGALDASWTSIGRDLAARLTNRLEEHARSSLGNLRYLHHLVHDPADEQAFGRAELEAWEAESEELAEDADDAVAIDDLWALAQGHPGICLRVRDATDLLWIEQLKKEGRWFE
jgi:hypothetical protein